MEAILRDESSSEGRVMIIHIDPATRIVGTERAWELQQTRTRNGEVTWELYKWFRSFRHALEEAVHRDIRLHPANGLSEAIQAADQIATRYSKLLDDALASGRGA